MKKGFILFAGLALLLVTPLSAMAQDAPKEPPKNSGYQGGFFTQNDDGSFKLTLNGGVKGRFYYQKQSLALGNISFLVRSASLGIGATIAKKGSLSFTLKHATAPAVAEPNPTFRTVNIDAATASYNFAPEFAVKVGMTGLPLDLATGSLLVESPITSSQTDGIKELTPLRDAFGAPAGLGLDISGTLWKFNYDVGIVNGNEDNYQANPDKKVSAGASLSFDVFDPATGSPSDLNYSETPKLTFNVGGNYQCKRTDSNTGADINYILQATFGGRFQWKGFGLTSQTYYRKTRFNNIGTAVWARPRLTDFGYYVDASYFVIPKKFEVAAEVAQIFRQGPDNDSWSMGGGLNYYIFGENLKAQLVYTLSVDFDDITGTESNKIHTVSVQLQNKF